MNLWPAVTRVRPKHNRVRCAAVHFRDATSGRTEEFDVGATACDGRVVRYVVLHNKSWDLYVYIRVIYTVEIRKKRG